jgi:hypothetical protein
VTLSGFFRREIGYVRARVTLRRLRWSWVINFMIDTGAHQTMLLPDDGLAFGLPYGVLGRSVSTAGIGGTSTAFTEDAFIAFCGSDRSYVYRQPVLIAASEPRISLPSVLGRDILNRWNMSYRPAERALSFDVVSADATFALA